ncbi:MAG: hypothetical protein AAGA45_03540 [Verrucomicrobiota bacterium]
MRCLFLIMICCLIPALLQARARQIDLGKKSSFADQTQDMEIQRPEMNNSLGGKRMQLVEWHHNFSSLGRQKADITNQDVRLNGNVLEYGLQEKRTKKMTMSGSNRREAQVRNWNFLKENVMAAKYSGSEITSPAGRRMQQMIDEVSLQEINRFSFERNMTDEGIPAQRAGEGQLSNIPEQFQVEELPEGQDEGISMGPQQLFIKPVETSE